MGEQGPSCAEYVQAAAWLERHGVRVGIPPRLLALRLGVLALGAVVCAVIVTGVVRRPVLAEDEPSAAVDAVPGFAPWLIGYAVLALALQLAGALVGRSPEGAR
ncbi:hypothetical protein ILP97_08850 [Amycolatopsis sp. H6(2020)]|nr:hypothetical protein [Amycolatopsis sp. H6(2020)]